VRTNVLTIDVEDWYHPLEPEPDKWSEYEDRIADSTHTILDVMDAANTRGTFFVLGHVARRCPAIVEDIARRGHEVATHGSRHQFVYRQTPEEFEADVRESMDLLTSITGQPVVGYRAPYFSITKESLWALPTLRRLGIRYDSSVFPVWNHRYGIPDAPRLPHDTEGGPFEIPLSTYPFGRLNFPCCGGVYFRFFPYGVTRRFLRGIARRAEPIVFYVHPWECDPGHPRIPLPAMLRLRHYWGLHRTADKLLRLMRDFSFRPVQEALDS